VKLDNIKLAVVGLGYVGLPLAIEFSKTRKVIGFDVSGTRVSELCNSYDRSNEVDSQVLDSCQNIDYTTNIDDISECNCYILTVPTPIDEFNMPDLRPLMSASEAIGRILTIGDIVIYESTVYPGCTEDDCVPKLEEFSGLKYNKDFFCGYSPERINPGDKEHRLPNIKKVTAGSNPFIASLVDDLYSEIILAGTHKAPSIKVAEASKIIENTQRDLNIALVNELAMIFNKMGLDTQAILEASGTKWNFLPFRPGLVGGHCIGVDPYYLTYKAQSIGYEPEIILAGRKVNDGMAVFVATQLINALKDRSVDLNRSKILIMGLTFKENCPDTRNTKIIGIVKELEKFNCCVDIYDPVADIETSNLEVSHNIIESPSFDFYDAAIVAVNHDIFRELGVEKIREWITADGILFDLKYTFPDGSCDLKL
jgi:UDP-N-acetyl-D-galactosamine dehydrogenase